MPKLLNIIFFTGKPFALVNECQWLHLILSNIPRLLKMCWMVCFKLHWVRILRTFKVNFLFHIVSGCDDSCLEFFGSGCNRCTKLSGLLSSSLTLFYSFIIFFLLLFIFCQDVMTRVTNVPDLAATAAPTAQLDTTWTTTSVFVSIN